MGGKSKSKSKAKATSSNQPSSTSEDPDNKQINTNFTSTHPVNGSSSANGLSATKQLLSKSSIESSSAKPTLETETTYSIESFLECKICLDACASPIYNCPNGHLICGFCHDKLAANCVPSCPLRCIGSLSISFFAERVSREHELTFECQFKESGCSEPIKATLIKDHVKSCEYRDITCKMASGAGGCNELISMGKYAQHLVDVHSKIVSTNKNSSIGFILVEPFIEGNQKALDYWKGSRPYETTMIQFDSQTFLFHVIIHEDSLHWWFTILGNTKVSEKYEVETRMRRPGWTTCHYDTITILPVLPFHKHPTFNRFSGSYATMSAGRLTKFYAEKYATNPEKHKFTISWNFVPVSGSGSLIDELRMRKRKAEEELTNINRRLEALEISFPK